MYRYIRFTLCVPLNGWDYFLFQINHNKYNNDSDKNDNENDDNNDYDSNDKNDFVNVNEVANNDRVTQAIRFCLWLPIPDYFARYLFNDEVEEEKKEKQAINTPELITQAERSITSGHIELCEYGVGGTYFIRDITTNNKFAVFKPTDEEPGAINNPKKLVTSTAVQAGEGAIREVAAYMLDNNFAGVPETHLLRGVTHSSFASSNMKTGSLQKFVENDGDSTELGSNLFTVESIHHVGIQDIRLFNTDRNGENMLIVKKIQSAVREYDIIPIDHAGILPDSIDNPYFDWLYWSQAKKQFSPFSLEYIEKIDIAHDACVLRELGISEECIKTMVISTLFMKKAAANGWTLFEIASAVCKKATAQHSKLQELVVMASEEKEKNSLHLFECFVRVLDDFFHSR